jgi:GNAT superfamily N-acetyltransferase
MLDDHRQRSTRVSPIEIRAARTRAKVGVVQSLMWEYRTWLKKHVEAARMPHPIVVEGLRRLDEEIQSLPGAYSPPEGMLFVAMKGRTPIGCAALRMLSPGVGELKRVYVRRGGRGQGIGRRLTRAALNYARRLGYRRIVLDTLPTMRSAVALYRKMGFQPIPKYWSHPLPEALFFEYRLDRRIARR